ncbi:MAG: hypothetical protein JEY99_08630 [Spirochaetales bacterium]|nr:hypothetical protein [Spirochaetales bacterium]
MIPIYSYILSMLTYTVFLILMTEGFRRSVFFGIAVNIGLIVLLFFSKNVEGWFRWAKDLSVLIPMVAVGLGRIASKKELNAPFWKFFKGPAILGFLCFILSLNIFEASLKDIQLGNYFNGLCGLIMIACIPMNIKSSWRFDKNNFSTLVSDLSLGWCLLYTTWNACFVYAESPAFVSASLCILLVPELYNFFSKKKKISNLWLHARIYTLMLHVSIRSFHDVFTPFMNATSWYNEAFKDVWGVINFILMAAYAVWWFTAIARKRRKKEHITA